MTAERESAFQYNDLDNAKRTFQADAQQTVENVDKFGIHIIKETLGESASAAEIEGTDITLVHTTEGLGTKSSVARHMAMIREIRGETEDFHDFFNLGICTALATFNDMATVGAQPLMTTAYFAVHNGDWFANQRRTEALSHGFREGCNMVDCSWVGGETPGFDSIMQDNEIDLGCSASGIIRPKERLISGKNLQAGDRILLVPSGGLHTNGFTDARHIASQLPDGYATLLPEGTRYGDALLTPTKPYVRLVQDLLNNGIDIHYLVNITGHGFRKIMRADRNDLRYVIEHVPQPQPIFQFIQEQGNFDNRKMYSTYNMGAGYAIYVPQPYVAAIQEIAQKNHQIKIIDAGYVANGPREVVLEELGITYGEETLQIR